MPIEEEILRFAVVEPSSIATPAGDDTAPSWYPAGVPRSILSSHTIVADRDTRVQVHDAALAFLGSSGLTEAMTHLAHDVLAAVPAPGPLESVDAARAHTAAALEVAAMQLDDRLETWMAEAGFEALLRWAHDASIAAAVTRAPTEQLALAHKLLTARIYFEELLAGADELEDLIAALEEPVLLPDGVLRDWWNTSEAAVEAPDPDDELDALRAAYTELLGLSPEAPTSVVGDLHESPPASLIRKTLDLPDVDLTDEEVLYLHDEERAAVGSVFVSDSSRASANQLSETTRDLLVRRGLLRPELAGRPLQAAALAHAKSGLRTAIEATVAKKHDHIADVLRGRARPMSSAVPYGVGVLTRVEQTVKGYQLGPLAHVESVLAGEEWTRKHERITEDVEEFLYEEEDVEEEEESWQETDTLTLASAVESQRSATSRLSAGASVSVDFGKVFKADLAATYSTSTSRSLSTKSAQRFARKTLSSARRVMEARRSESLRRLRSKERRETNTHSLTNDGSATHTGRYHWVDEVRSTRLVTYGRRLMYEVIVADPGQLLRPPVADLPEDELATIDETNYAAFAGRYGIVLPAPPPHEQTVAWTGQLPATEGDSGGHETGSFSTTLSIPDGTFAKHVTLGLQQAWTGFGRRSAPRYQVANRVGHFDQPFTPSGGLESHSLEKLKAFAANATSASINLWPRWGRMAGGVSTTPKEPPSAPAWLTGQLPISVQVYHRTGAVLVCHLVCQRTPESMEAWKAQCIQAVRDAARERQDAIAEQALADEIGGFGSSFVPPGELRRRERDEIRRGVVDALLRRTRPAGAAPGDGLSGLDVPLVTQRFGSVRVPGLSGDASAIERYGALVQFVEQTFDWRNMTWELFPYFWSDVEGWDQRLRLEHPDPEHLAFLQAGGARVMLPVVLGAEHDALRFTHDGSLWDSTGGKRPSVVAGRYRQLYDAVRPPKEPLPSETLPDMLVPTTHMILKSAEDTLRRITL